MAEALIVIDLQNDFCPGGALAVAGGDEIVPLVNEMIARFRERAAAVKQRPLPPVAGAERTHFIEQAKIDFQDFAIIGDAEGVIEDGVLVLRVDLRPADQRS